jgi:hypothetical protein
MIGRFSVKSIEEEKELKAYITKEMTKSRLKYLPLLIIQGISTGIAAYSQGRQ